MGDLDGRVAVVTGGARGIGLGIVECLSEVGASVVIADVNLEQAQESAMSLDGRPAIAVQHDVRKTELAEDLRKRTLDEFGRVDILVNNAGVGSDPAPIQDVTDEEYDRVMDVNCRGVFITTRAFVPTFIEQRSGRIVNISSIVGQSGYPLVIPYVASKFAVTGMTQSLSRELAAYNVTVNSVHPGMVDTDLHGRVMARLSDITEEDIREKFTSMIPLGRFQTARDMGEMVAFLASDRAQNITGASFNVDGGWEMH